jgi:hypothetical protein
LKAICTPTLCISAELVDRIQEVEKDSAGSQGLHRRLLKTDARFVPVPIPISNPTIGSGLGAALLYLHSKNDADPKQPTSTTGLLGMYTNTESWAVGAFHDGFYFKDRTRLRAAAGYGEFNLKFYGIGNIDLGNNPIKYKADTLAFMPRALFRLPKNNWFFGPHYYYLNIETEFDLSSILPNLPAINDQTKTAGLGLIGLYDSRDNNLWPNDGTWFEATATNYGEHFGGDFAYNKLMLKFGQYFPLGEPVTLAYRLDGQFIDGDAPFYDLSQIRLRGFPGGRYLNDIAVTAQTEVRWKFFKHWTALAFGGVGWIAEDIDVLFDDSAKPAGGVGLRYMIAEKQKLNIGLDVTYGDGNIAIYVQIGDWLAN